MSKSSEVVGILQKHSPEKGKKKLYEYDSLALSKAAFLETMTGANLPNPEQMAVQAETIVQNALATVKEHEAIIDVQTSLLRSQLSVEQQQKFDTTLADYNKAQARSRRGLLGSMSRQKKLGGLGNRDGKIVITEAAKLEDPRLQYIANMPIRSSRLQRALPRIEAEAAPIIAPAQEIAVIADSPEQPLTDENEALILGLLNMQRLADGSLEVIELDPFETSISQEALESAEEAPVPIAPETVMMAEANIPEPVREELPIPTIAEINSTSPAPTEAPSTPEQKRKKERLVKRMLGACGRALKKICRELTDVTPGGLARAAVKTALPIAGAALPLLGGESFVVQDPVLVSLASATLVGSLGSIASNSMFPDRRRSGKFFRNGIRQGGALTRNLIIGAVAAASLAPDSYSFQPLLDIARYAEAGTAHAGETRAAYGPAIDIFKDPASIGERFFKGEISMEDLVQANTVQIVRTRIVDGQPVEQEVPVTAKPIIFIDEETGEVLFSYHRAIFDPLEATDVPDGLFDLVDVVEELPNESPVNTVMLSALPELEATIEAEIGPLDELPADTFFLRLLNRNVIQKLLHGNAAISGASTVDMQFFKNAFGRAGESSVINPEIDLQVYHPERYSISYLFELMKAARRGEVLDPQEIVDRAQLQENEMSLIDANGLRKYINDACQQYERYMYGKYLAEREGYQLAYLNNLRLGSIYGHEVIGVQGISWMMFNKPLSETSKAEQLIILSSIPQGSKVTNLFEHGESVQFNYEIFQNAVETNAERAFARGQLGDEEMMEDIRAEIKRIFTEKTFFGEIPDHMFSTWIQSDFIQGDMRETIEDVITETLPEMAADTDVTIAREGVYVSLDVPRFIEPQQMEVAHVDFQTRRVYDQLLANFIDTRLKPAEAKGLPFFQGEFGGKVRRIPSFEVAPGEFVPGLGIVMVDEKGELIADFDETGSLLTDAPIQVGSTMKPFVYAFGRYMGYIDSPKDMTNDKPGRFGLAQGEFDVVNASKPLGKMTWEQALAKSRNVPFQRILYQHLYHDLEGLDPIQREAEVTKRWKEFTDFLAQFGVKLVNVEGYDITNPADEDPTKRAELAAIGTDVFITSTENTMVDGQLDINESSMGAFAAAYMRLHNPEAFFTDSKMVEICDEIPGMLKGLGLARTKETGKADESWAKTGTVFTVKGTTGTLTVFVVQEGDKSRVVMVHNRGQTVDENGLAQEMDLDVAFRLAKVGNESFKDAYPLAKDLALESLNYETADIIPTDAIESSLESGNSTAFNYRPIILTAETPVRDPRGELLNTVPAGSIVDAVGEPKDGLQQVVIRSTFGQIQIMSSGFVSVDSTKPFTEVQDPQVDDILRIMGEEGMAQINNPNLIVVGPKTTSPLFATIYAELAANNELAGGSGRFDNLPGLPANTIFVNETRLHDFIGTEPLVISQAPREAIIGGDTVTSNETATTRALLQAELIRVAEIQQVQAKLAEFGFNEEVRTILQNPNTPAYRLLQALTTGRENNYRDNALLAPILFREATDEGLSEDLEDIPRLIELYQRLISPSVAYPFEQSDARTFMYLLGEMATNPTHGELQAFGIQSELQESADGDTTNGGSSENQTLVQEETNPGESPL